MTRTPAVPRGIELSPLLTVRGRTGAHKWITEVLGVPVRQNLVTQAAHDRRISCVKIGGALMFSTQSLFDWASHLGDDVEAAS